MGSNPVLSASVGFSPVSKSLQSGGLISPECGSSPVCLKVRRAMKVKQTSCLTTEESSYLFPHVVCPRNPVNHFPASVIRRFWIRYAVSNTQGWIRNCLINIPRSFSFQVGFGAFYGGATWLMVDLNRKHPVHRMGPTLLLGHVGVITTADWAWPPVASADSIKLNGG